MTSQVKALAVHPGKTSVEAFEYEPRSLCPYDVEVKITHCGVCASDVLLADTLALPRPAPVVPGHEIVGFVVSAGDKAELTVGQRVGVGGQGGSCGDCGQCAGSTEQYCASRLDLLRGTHAESGTRSFGGFAQRLVVDSRFAYALPEVLPSAQAAPLMCAGVTVFSPLKRYSKPGSRVGVVGIGGLGHMAVQFAKAMGRKVTAISHTPDKEELARKLGADAFVNSGDTAAMAAAAKSLDFLLVTVGKLDWDAYLNLLDVDGGACLVGLSLEKQEFSAYNMIVRGLHLHGSVLASPAEVREMLALAAEHNVVSMVDEMPMSQANEAMDRVRQGKPRFRDVLVQDLE